MPTGFEVRGVIEGFYGAPWSHDARLAVVEHLAPRGMNAYVYAPKDDPHHRSRWRESYDAEVLSDLLELAAHCRRLDVRFGFAVSPGLDIDARSADDRATLWEKLEPFAEVGVDWFVLAFDDVPMRDGAGRAHGELARWLQDRSGVADVTVVPTDYVGTQPTPYLEELAESLPPEVDLVWTGRTVVPAVITADEARARRAATGDHPLLIWDNYPVNDAFMAASLHLGPVRGRDPELAAATRGVLANPMPHPNASLVALSTVMDFLRDPEGYDPESSWSRAIDDTGGEAAAALGVLSRACASSALASPRELPLQRLVEQLEAGEPGAVDRLRAELGASRGLLEHLEEPMRSEVAPWVEQAGREAQVGLAALDALGAGHPHEAGAWSQAFAVMGMLVLWADVRRRGGPVVFGPRFACYPAIVQGPDGSVGVDAARAVVEDASAIDRLCRAVLARVGVPQ